MVCLFVYFHILYCIPVNLAKRCFEFKTRSIRFCTRSDSQFLRKRKTNKVQTTFNTEHKLNSTSQLNYTYIDRVKTNNITYMKAKEK